MNACSQALTDAPLPGATEPVISGPYTAPTAELRFKNLMLDSLGPYPILISAAVAGDHQFTNDPPEWRQGARGYARRFGSGMGINIIDGTTRYGLSELLKQDTLYYRCACTGVFPRTWHAVLMTAMARKESDGKSVISIPSLISPYIATTTAVYGWYPARFGPKDAFRLGNYDLLEDIGANIVFEFFPSRPSSFLSRHHFNSRHAAINPE